ncbi:MAG: aldehyde dehydrogenase family protein [Candidatus Heimdallarchaeaceae archaeon]
MASIDALPLLRNGEEYFSATKQTLMGIHGEKLLDVSIAPEIHVQMALGINKNVGFKSLQNIEIDDLIDIYVEAGKIFSKDMLIGGISTNVHEFAELVTLSTGLPIKDVLNTYNAISQTFKKRNLKRILKANSPTGNLSIYDDNVGQRGGLLFGWAPRGKNVGISLPSNHPGVALLGTLIPLFKLPAIVRASSKEPFTSFRICKALWEAGLPYESLFHFVTAQETVNTVVTKSDLGMIFGNEWILKAYEHNPRIKTFGPGRSKILIDFDNPSPTALDIALDIAYTSIALDGGRGCINASTIIYNSDTDYEDFKMKLAERLAKLTPKDPLRMDAELPATKPEGAKGLYKFIQSRMKGDYVDLTEQYRGTKEFLVEEDNLAYFLPLLLEVHEEHPMLTDEYPFPFGTITQPQDYYAHELARNSLSVALLTDDPFKAQKLLVEPTIHKVFVNDRTFLMDPAAPHEGFLADFLYVSKATNTRGIEDLPY